MTDEMCGKDFKKILKITKHLKQHESFVIPRQRFKHFRYLLRQEKVYLIGRFPTYPVKNLRSTVLCELTLRSGYTASAISRPGGYEVYRISSIVPKSKNK